MAADLVLYDPATVASRATIAEPHAASTGIRTVWVNGAIVFQDGKPTGVHSGRALRRAVRAADTTVVPRVERFVREEMARQKIPGVAVAVIRNGVVQTARGYGWANVEHMVPVTDETIFQSGSLGKMFTATLVMMLVEDGKLSLADTITKFFPDAPPAWRSITVRNLLNHTSGIPDSYGDGYDFRKDYTEEELWRMAYRSTPEFPAGSRWNYSNTGYQLLGFIVGKVTGRFYGDVLVDRVFRPAGMTTARIITEADIVPHRSEGYELVDGVLKHQEWVAPKLNTTADGSLYWSLRDLIAWDAVIRDRGLLTPASWQQILTPVRLTSGKTYPYGMGWSLDERGGRPMWGHGGSWQGFKTQLTRFLGDSLDIIVLANLGEADPSAFVDGIAAIYDSTLIEPPLAPIADREPRALAKLTKVLDALRSGTLTPAEFAYVRAGFFPGAADFYKRRLGELGKPSRAVLVRRREIGDDRIYTYELAFGDQAYYATLGLAPDDRVSQFSLRPKSPQ